jgi:hypothetical protein
MPHHFKVCRRVIIAGSQCRRRVAWDTAKSGSAMCTAFTTTCHMQKSWLLAPLDQAWMNKKSDLTQLVP